MLLQEDLMSKEKHIQFVPTFFSYSQTENDFKADELSSIQFSTISIYRPINLPSESFVGLGQQKHLTELELIQVPIKSTNIESIAACITQSPLQKLSLHLNPMPASCLERLYQGILSSSISELSLVMMSLGDQHKFQLQSLLEKKDLMKINLSFNQFSPECMFDLAIHGGLHGVEVTFSPYSMFENHIIRASRKIVENEIKATQVNTCVLQIEKAIEACLHDQDESMKSMLNLKRKTDGLLNQLATLLDYNDFYKHLLQRYHMALGVAFSRGGEDSKACEYFQRGATRTGILSLYAKTMVKSIKRSNDLSLSRGQKVRGSEFNHDIPFSPTTQFKYRSQDSKKLVASKLKIAKRISELTLKRTNVHLNY